MFLREALCRHQDYLVCSGRWHLGFFPKTPAQVLLNVGVNQVFDAHNQSSDFVWPL